MHSISHVWVRSAEATDVNPLPVEGPSGSLTVDDGGTSLTVDDGGGALTVDGTVAVNNFPDLPTNADAPIKDAAGRVQINQAYILGDYRFVHDVSETDTNAFSTYTTGTGAGAFQASTNSYQLSVAANNDVSMLQTIASHPYFSGQSQQVEFTLHNFNSESGAVKRAGYYFHNSLAAPVPSSTANLDGVFLQSDGSGISLNIYREGTQVLQVYQGSWSGDNLDGTGDTGITINWTYFQIHVFEFLYLGGAGLNWYMYLNGQRILIHNYAHSPNVEANTFVGSPNQPLTFSIHSTGSTTAKMDFVCGQVSTSNNISFFSGTRRAAYKTTLASGNMSAGSIYPLIGIRLRNNAAQHRNVSIFLRGVDVGVTAASEVYVAVLVLNPTLVGTAAVWTSYDHIQIGRANQGNIATTCTYNDTDVIIAKTIVSRTEIDMDPGGIPRLGAPVDMSSTWREFWVVLYVLTSGVNTAHASISWDEYH